MRSEGIYQKLKVLITFRVLFVSLLLGAFFVLKLEYSFFPYPRIISLLIAVIFVLNILYLLMIRGRKIPPQVQGYAQLILDVIAVNILILATGGIESWFTVTLLLVVIAASIVLGKRAGFIIATCAGILYGVLVDLQYFNVLPVGYSSNLTEKNFLFNIFINLSAVYLSAYLSGYLISGLEKTKKTLDEKSTDLTQLSLFHKDVIENIPSGLFSSGLEGNVRLFNRAAEQITGVIREEALAMKVNEIFPFVTFPVVPKRYEGTIVTNHKKKHIGMSISVHRDNADQEIGYIGTFQDLTDIVRLENEIKRKEKFSAIGELSANIAHEIRNPLASIKGSIEMIREDKIKETDKVKLMGIALNEMTRLNDIITNFLSYSNPKPLSLKRDNISDLLSNTLTLLKSSLSGGTSNIQFSENIGPFLLADVDTDKLRQVFWNLLTNAVQAIQGPGKISVRAWKHHDEILIEISDTGEGILQRDMERIFYPFYTTKKSGTGLGLAIAYRIIEEHNGSIEVKSGKGEGTVFLIRVPIQKPERI